MSMESIVEILKADYQKFPKDQTFEIYDREVYFKDPTSEFRGIDRYRKTIAFIDQWFQDPCLTLHEIAVMTDRTIRTDWTLTWTTPLPWKPRIAITGWSELGLNSQGLINSHIDYWQCSLWDVLKQHVSRASG
ncbi:DUF2358 domain-containing protein [Limnothrix redekei]